MSARNQVMAAALIAVAFLAASMLAELAAELITAPRRRRARLVDRLTEAGYWAVLDQATDITRAAAQEDTK